MFELRCHRLRHSFIIHKNYDIYGSFKTASIHHGMAKVQQWTIPALRQHKYDKKCTILILGLCLLRGIKKWRHDSIHIRTLRKIFLTLFFSLWAKFSYHLWHFNSRKSLKNIFLFFIGLYVPSEIVL